MCLCESSLECDGIVVYIVPAMDLHVYNALFFKTSAEHSIKCIAYLSNVSINVLHIV